jgi:pimeloyl-ACP methyl ester carboxylesterase
MRQESFLSLGPDGFHRVAYCDWGDPDAGHVVMCVHGLSRNARDFDYLAGTLERSCRVVCMVVVGRGDSDWLQDKSGYSFRTYLYDAAALIARVTTPTRPGLFRGSRATALDWVGTSMGGLIGMLLAARPHSPIRRLVLNDVGPCVPWGALFRLKGHVGGHPTFATLHDAEAYLREACASFGIRGKAQWRHLVRTSVRSRKNGGYELRYDPAIGRPTTAQIDPELPLGAEFMRGVDVWNAWNEVRCPVLVLRGAESDVLTRATVEQMRKRKPDIEVVEFPGVGHAPALFDSGQIKVVRDFLLRRRVGASARESARAGA